MATRRSTGVKAPAKNQPASAQGGRGKKKPAKGGKSRSWVVLFWLAFVIFIFGFFLFNREAISDGLATIKNEMASRSSSRNVLPVPPPDDDPPGEDSLSSDSPPAVPSSRPEAPRISIESSRSSPSEPAEPASTPRQSPASSTPTRTTPPREENSGPETPRRNVPADKPAPSETSPSTQAGQTAATPARPAAQPAVPAREQRERALYFTRVDTGGSILRIKVNRGLPVSDSPMTDVIQALIAGPNEAEKSRGLISLIPPDTRILSATVRGNTAYISFSEDFQYNVYGVEGYAGQLRQIVFTVTEFPNIRDVQILIEGRRVDYLGEGIWIGSPVSREML